MYRLLSISFALFLSACATTLPSSSFFQGNSTTYGNDNILRNDVVSQIKQIEKLGYDCKQIESVTPKILDVKQVNGLNHVQELWSVKACGKTHSYPVTLRESATGGVDFTVTFKKQ